MDAASKGTGPGARWKAPGLRDPRLLLGIALVLVSVLGVAWLVASMQRTQDVYVAGKDLSAGTRVSEQDLSVAHVRLQDAASLYLTPDTGLKAGSVVTDSLAKGELVPTRSIGQADASGRRPVSVEIEGALPSGVDRGANVDVFRTPTGSRAAGKDSVSAEVVADHAEVTEVITDEKSLAGSRTTVVRLLVSGDDVAPLLAARAAGDRLDVVPVQLGSEG